MIPRLHLVYCFGRSRVGLLELWLHPRSICMCTQSVEGRVCLCGPTSSRATCLGFVCSLKQTCMQVGSRIPAALACDSAEVDRGLALDWGVCRQNDSDAEARGKTMPDVFSLQKLVGHLEGQVVREACPEPGRGLEPERDPGAASVRMYLMPRTGYDHQKNHA